MIFPKTTIRKRKFPIDREKRPCYNPSNFIGKTVDAEVKAVMTPQRARGAESRVGNKPS
jgi:hypothetical protein